MIPSPTPGMLLEFDNQAPQQAAGSPVKHAAWQREMERAFAAWFHHPEVHAVYQQERSVSLSADGPEFSTAATGDHVRQDDGDRQDGSSVTSVTGQRAQVDYRSGEQGEVAEHPAFEDNGGQSAASTTELALSSSPVAPVSDTGKALSAPLAEKIAYLLSQPVIEIGSSAEAVTLPTRLQPVQAPMFSLSVFRPMPAEEAAYDALPTSFGAPRGMEKPTSPAIQPPVRMHAEWTDNGVRLWLGADSQASADIPRISQLLVDWLRMQGTQLLSLICNGRTIYAPSAQAAGNTDSDGPQGTEYSTTPGLPSRRIDTDTLQFRFAAACRGSGQVAQDFFTYLYHQEA